MSDDVLFFLDASSGDPYLLAHGLRAGVLSDVDEFDGYPYSRRESIGFIEPRNWRFSDLDQLTTSNLEDRRLELQLIAEPGPAPEGQYPFGQPGMHSARNRSTRVIDAVGRVGLLSQALRVVDSADQRYTMAIPLRSTVLPTFRSTAFNSRSDSAGSLFDGTEGLQDFLSRLDPDTAPDRSKDQGLGYVWADGAPKHFVENGSTGTRTRDPDPDERGISKAGRLSSVFMPEAQRLPSPFTRGVLDQEFGLENTPINKLPIRCDVVYAMGPVHPEKGALSLGPILFVDHEALGFAEHIVEDIGPFNTPGSFLQGGEQRSNPAPEFGTFFKGEMWHDQSVGLDSDGSGGGAFFDGTGAWRPVIGVDTRIGSTSEAPINFDDPSWVKSKPKKRPKKKPPGGGDPDPDVIIPVPQGFFGPGGLGGPPLIDVPPTPPGGGGGISGDGITLGGPTGEPAVSPGGIIGGEPLSPQEEREEREEEEDGKKKGPCPGEEDTTGSAGGTTSEPFETDPLGLGGLDDFEQWGSAGFGFGDTAGGIATSPSGSTSGTGTSSGENDPCGPGNTGPGSGFQVGGPSIALGPDGIGNPLVSPSGTGTLLTGQGGSLLNDPIVFQAGEGFTGTTGFTPAPLLAPGETLEDSLRLTQITLNSLQQMFVGLTSGRSELLATINATTGFTAHELNQYINAGAGHTNVGTGAFTAHSAVNAEEGASVDLGGTGVFTVRSEKRGAGTVNDVRPMLLLDPYEDRVGDMISSVDHRYYVDSDGVNVAAGMAAYAAPGEIYDLIDVGLIDEFSGDILDSYLEMSSGGDDQGWLISHPGIAVDEGPIEIRDGGSLILFPEDVSAFGYGFTAGADGLLTLADTAGVFDVNLTVPIISVEKINCSGLIDPTGVVLTSLASGGTEMGAGQAGIEYDGDENARPRWKEDNIDGDNATHTMAYLSDVTGGGGVHDSDSATEANQSSGGSGLETLKTITLLGGTLAANGDIAVFRAGGRIAAASGGSARNIFFSFGGSATSAGSMIASGSEGYWNFVVHVTRTGAATQIVQTFGVTNTSSTAGTPSVQQIRSAKTSTLSGDITCLVQVQDLNSENDISCDYFYADLKVQ